MSKTVLAWLLLLAASPCISADPGSGCCTCPLPPITLVSQPPPPPAKCGPNLWMPSPVLYPASATPPKWAAVPPPRPVTLYEVPPPPIKTVCFTPPTVPLCRAEVKPPKWTEMPPHQPVTLYSARPRPLKEAPCLALPPVTLLSSCQPAGPVYLGCVRPAYANGGPGPAADVHP